MIHNIINKIILLLRILHYNGVRFSLSLVLIFLQYRINYYYCMSQSPPLFFIFADKLTQARKGRKSIPSIDLASIIIWTGDELVADGTFSAGFQRVGSKISFKYQIIQIKNKKQKAKVEVEVMTIFFLCPGFGF